MVDLTDAAADCCEIRSGFQVRYVVALVLKSVLLVSLEVVDAVY